MSFATLDYRAPRRVPLAAVLSERIVARRSPDITHQTKASTWLGSSERVLFLVIGALLLCIGAALIYQPGHLVAEHLFAPSELHPTCSAERDCVIAPPAALRPETRAPEMNVAPAGASIAQFERHTDRAEDDVTGSILSYGALVVPPSHWSTPAELPAKTLPTAQGPMQRLSAALAAASTQPKQPAARQGKQQKRSPAPYGAGAHR